MKSILLKDTTQAKQVVADTNVLIRLIINDEHGQVKKIRQIIKDLPKKSVFVPDMVIAETVFVLTSYYEFEKGEVVQALTRLLSIAVFSYDETLITKTFEQYIVANIHFTDAYILSLTLVGRAQSILSFDKKLLSAVKKS